MIESLITDLILHKSSKTTYEVILKVLRVDCSFFEDIATDYVEALGGHFRIDPAFFARQLRVVNWENSQEASTAPSLPSLSDSEQSFSISYPQVLKFSNLNIRKHSGLYCYSNVYRAIDAIRVNHWFDRMAYIKRMISVWSRRYPGGYWDGESGSRPPERLTDITLWRLEPFLICLIP